MKPRDTDRWRLGLTDAEVEALSPADRALLMEADKLDVEARDAEFGELPYNPVYDPDGKIIG